MQKKIVNYVNNNPQLELKDAITDHWISKHEGKINSMICGSSHGLFDKVFDRTIIMPREWSEFTNNFLTQEAELLKGIYFDCKIGISYEFGKKINDKQRHQNNYQKIINELKNKGHITKTIKNYIATNKEPVLQDKSSLECSRLNWKYNQETLLKAHPYLAQ